MSTKFEDLLTIERRDGNSFTTIGGRAVQVSVRPCGDDPNLVKISYVGTTTTETARRVEDGVYKVVR